MKIYSTGEVCNKPGDSDPTKCYNLDPGTENSPPCTQRAGADPGGAGGPGPPPDPRSRSKVPPSFVCLCQFSVTLTK